MLKVLGKMLLAVVFPGYFPPTAKLLHRVRKKEEGGRQRCEAHIQEARYVHKQQELSTDRPTAAEDARHTCSAADTRCTTEDKNGERGNSHNKVVGNVKRRVWSC